MSDVIFFLVINRYPTLIYIEGCGYFASKDGMEWVQCWLFG